MLFCSVLCYTVLYFAVLHCTALHCTVLCCTTLYCIVLHCTLLYSSVIHFTALHFAALHFAVLYCTVYCTVLYCTECYVLTVGTGVVTSVPSDAPDDYAALRDLQKKKVSHTHTHMQKHALKPGSQYDDRLPFRFVSFCAAPFRLRCSQIIVR